MENAGTITTLTNRGAISGGVGGFGPSADGVGGGGIGNAGTIATLSNTGTISGGGGAGGSHGGAVA